MKILDHYLYRTIIVATVLVSVVIMALDSFLTLIQQFRYVGEQQYHLAQVFLFVTMQLPAQFYQLFPMIGFLGTIIGLGRLSSTSQLIVMRAAGISVARILWSVLKVALMMIIVMTALGEGLGPRWQQEASRMQQRDLSLHPRASLAQSIWVRNQNHFIHIGTLENARVLKNITQYTFAPAGNLMSVIVAKSATRQHGQWKMSHVRQTLFLQRHIIVQQKQQAILPFVLHPNLQIQMEMISAEQTLVGLYRTIDYRQSLGLNTQQFIFAFWQRVIQPITTMIMICLAVPFVFGSLRSASMGMRIIAGILAGFMLYMLNQLFGPMTLVYQFPPILAAIIPTAVFLLILMGFLAWILR